MIQYTCDMCRQEIKVNESVHFIKDFPRRVQYWTIITTRDGDNKIPSFIEYGIAETHLCNGCFRRLADTLTVVK